VEQSPLADGTDEYIGLARKRDGVVFRRIGPSVYLPEGYEPETENWDPNSGTWPPVIVRRPENVRFLLILGGAYRRGDPDARVKDANDQPITPHWVKVQSFYIQETEVTNGEIEDHVERYAADADSLKDWRAIYTDQKRKISPEERARRWPASRINYLTAAKYAREHSGRLPTEAEWEFAARSRQSNRAFPWGNDSPLHPKKPKKANISDPLIGNDFAPDEVMKFRDDKTEQGVYDMAGNLSELCLDRYRPYEALDLAKYDENAPLEDSVHELLSAASEPDASHVLRGGSFLSMASKATTFYRGIIGPGESAPEIGFRVVIECPSPRQGPSS
jgi:serine/threonine-protein kinase